MTIAPPTELFTNAVIAGAKATSVGEQSSVRPVLMRPDEVWNIKSAADHARRDDKTIRRWAKVYGIGRQAGRGAPIEISRPALEMVLHGEWSALEALRSGDRSHPDVVRIFDHLGLPL